MNSAPPDDANAALACRLPIGDRAERTADFRHLFDAAFLERARVSNGVHWTLRATDWSEAESRRLGELETRCCDGIRFRIVRHEDRVVWQISGPPGARRALDAFYELPVLIGTAEGAARLWAALDAGACGPGKVRSTSVGVAILLATATLLPAPSAGQTRDAGEASAVVLQMVASVERALIGVAEEMPEDNYAFVPTEGAFRGVRTFARQIKHAAAVHHLVAATLLGEPVTADMSDDRGPDAVRTKAEILAYLRESFAALRRATATIDETNAFTAFKGPFGGGTDTHLGLIAVAVSHSWNHYGQVVPYLRMNGLAPPRTP